MADISMQGTLGAGSTLIYTCPSNVNARINFIFNNPAAYTITLSRYDDTLAITTDVYTFALSAGDTVRDSNNYYLNKNDSFTVTSSIGGTNYLIYLIEYPG